MNVDNISCILNSILRIPICSFDVQTQIKIKYDTKARFHVATFMLWRVWAILENVPIFWSNHNLDFRSYGQLLSLFLINFQEIKFVLDKSCGNRFPFDKKLLWSCRNKTLVASCMSSLPFICFLELCS